MGPRRGGDACDNVRYADPPTPFCEVDAPGAASSESLGALSTCLICCGERPRYAAVGRCGHAEVCWICAVRLRALLRDFHCPVCKEELPEVALVDDSAVEAGGLTGSSDPALRDETLGIVYASSEIRAQVERLFDYACWQRGCGRSYPTIGGLERHLREEHGRQFCPTCLYDRKVFLFEQTLYRPEDVERHRREGDDPRRLGRGLPPTPPHAPCSFCRRGFYSQDELLSHMHRQHHLCGLCERQGRRGEYYRDYAYLSLHYEEQHHVCMHDSCRRGTYRLVAFASEDELHMHEISEHSAAGERTSQRSRKQGVRLNVQMGTVSYREERRRQVAGQAGTPAVAFAGERPGAEATGGGEARVRFMWTRGQPPRAPQGPDGWSELLDGGVLAGDARDGEDGEGQRYPPRHSASGLRQRGCPIGPAVVAAAAAPAPDGVTATAGDSGAGGATGSRSWRRRSAASGGSGPGERPGAGAGGGADDGCRDQAHGEVVARLLGKALSKVEFLGLHCATEFDAEEYRERNRRFRMDLEAAFGSERLAEFKRHSASFRQATVEGAGAHDVAEAVRGYAGRVLDVFAAAQASVGEAAAANLLGELVVLLPDQGLRRSLFQQLRSMKATAADSSREAAAETAPRRTPFTRRHDAAAAAGTGRAAGAGGAPATPPAAPAGPTVHSLPAPLPPALEAARASEAFWDADDRQPSFLLALDVVLSALAQGSDLPRRPAVVSEHALTSQIRALDCHQAESLGSLQRHLTAAGAGHLDFSAMERLLALRPQLLLKLQGRGQEAARKGTDRAAGGWHEWKVAAAGAVRSLGAEERCCVQSYVRLCLRHLAGSLPSEEDAGPTMEEAFPALGEAVQPGSRQQPGAEALPSRGGRKGKQRQVLVAWG